MPDKLSFTDHRLSSTDWGVKNISRSPPHSTSRVSSNFISISHSIVPPYFASSGVFVEPYDVDSAGIFDVSNADIGAIPIESQGNKFLLNQA